MSGEIPALPDHPRLAETRVAQLGGQLVRELRHEPATFWSRGRPRRRSALVLATIVLLSVVGAGYAVGNSVLDVFDIRGGPTDPKRIGDRFEIATSDGWSLQAWTSTRGICLGVVLDGAPAGSGCGMPVVGAPPDTVFKQPRPTHLIGYMAGGAAGFPLYVTGPIAEGVARVEVELVDGRTLEAQVYEAPPTFDTDVDFYFLLDAASSESTFVGHPVKELRAYDDERALLERLVVPVR